MNGEGGERLLAGVELGRRRRSSRQRRVGWLGVGGKLRRDVGHVGRGGGGDLSGWDRQKKNLSFIFCLKKILYLYTIDSQIQY